MTTKSFTVIVVDLPSKLGKKKEFSTVGCYVISERVMHGLKLKIKARVSSSFRVH